MDVLQLSALGVALAAGGCILAEEPAESTVSSAICSVMTCAENAASAGDGLLFDELDVFLRANYAGVAMLGANLAPTSTLPAGLPVRIQILGDDLSAIDTATGTTYSGWQLYHTVIHFLHIPSGEHFDIRVEDYVPQSVTFMSGWRENIPVWLLKARRGGASNFDFYVCNNDALPVDPSWDIAKSHYALFYRGDRYDPGRKRLKPNSPSDGWSFLACNGSAASKLHMWRHTYAGGFDAAGNPRFMTADWQRTTLLKAITADYCGTGTPEFTMTGMPLAFATAKEPLAFPYPRTGPVTSMEATWGPEGIRCLDHPRREAFGINRLYVQSACGRTTPYPPCADAATPSSPPTGWYNNAHVLTANP